MQYCNIDEFFRLLTHDSLAYRRYGLTDNGTYFWKSSV